MDQPYTWELFWLDLTKTPAHTAQFAASAIVLIGIPLLMLIFRESARIGVSLLSIAVIAVGGLELYSYLYRDVPSNEWMLDTFGNFLFGVGVSLIVFLTVCLQIFHTQNLLGYLTDDDNMYVTGFGSFGIAFILAAILELFDRSYPTVVMLLLAAFQIFIVFHPIVKAARRGHYVWDAILAGIVYIACMAGLLAVVAHFILMAVILVIFSCGVSYRGSTTSVELDDGDTLHHDYGNQWSGKYGDKYTDVGGGLFKRN